MPQRRSRDLKVEVEEWPLIAPFRIAGYTFESIEVVLVTVQQNGCVGRGEAGGVYYRDEKPARMVQQIEQLRPAIESHLNRSALQQMLPQGALATPWTALCGTWTQSCALARYGNLQIFQNRNPF